MTSLYLVRHGQTAWNKEEIFRGRSDIPLNETGLKQAELTATYFQGMKIAGVFSSPLLRATQTAQKIAEPQSLNVMSLGGMIDMSFGDWEGRSLQEIKKTDGEIYRQWVEEPHRVRIPGGETLEAIRERAMASLEGLVQEYPEETVVLVSHRVINKVLLCGILGLDNSHFWQMTQDATAINLIQYKRGKYILSLMNETCHLKALKKEGPKIDF